MELLFKDGDLEKSFQQPHNQTVAIIGHSLLNVEGGVLSAQGTVWNQDRNASAHVVKFSCAVTHQLTVLQFIMVFNFNFKLNTWTESENIAIFQLFVLGPYVQVDETRYVFSFSFIVKVINYKYLLAFDWLHLIVQN